METLFGFVSFKTLCIALTAAFAAIGFWFNSDQSSRGTLVRRVALCGAIAAFIMAVALDAAETRSKNLAEADERRRNSEILTQIARSVLGITKVTVDISIVLPFAEYPDDALKDEILAARDGAAGDNRASSRLIAYDHGEDTPQSGFLSFFDIDGSRLGLLKDNFAPSVYVLDQAGSAKESEAQDYLTGRFDFSDSANVYSYVERRHATAAGASATDKWFGVESKVTFDMTKDGHRPDLRSILDLNGAVLSIDLFSAWFPGSGARDDTRDAQVLRSLAHGKLLGAMVTFEGYGKLCLAGDDFTQSQHDKAIDVWRSGVHVLDQTVVVPHFSYRLPKDILSSLNQDTQHCLTLRVTKPR